MATLELARSRRPSSLVDPTGQVPNPPHPEPPTPPDPPLPDPVPDPLEPPGPIHDPSAPSALREIPLDDLILRPVRFGGVRIGTVVDVVLNTGLRHVLGVDVVHHGAHRFLPWVALRARPSDLALTNALALYPSSGLSLFLSHGTRLSQTWHRGALVIDRFGDIRVGRATRQSDEPHAGT